MPQSYKLKCEIINYYVIVKRKNDVSNIIITRSRGEAKKVQ